MRKFILGIDEGTTSTRSVLYDIKTNKIIDMQSKKFAQFYPNDGWVEQDADEIISSLMYVSKALLKRNDVQEDELLGVGITNQRETVVAWDRLTGEPVYHAIVWQCRRTTDFIKKLPEDIKVKIKQKTGLIPDPYFSASKMHWILKNIPKAKQLAKEGNLCFGTIDCFIAFKLTGNFVTDTTNASRTMLMNIKTLSWDKELCDFFKIPMNSLPEIKPCNTKFGIARKLLNAPVCSIIGDQQSSMIGQGAIGYGDAKVTLGTGGFILANIGQSCKKDYPKLLTTVASTIDGVTQYAVEGSIYSACSALNWLKSGLDLYDDVEKLDSIADSLPDNEGVYVVPAFTGLGAPYWNNDARAEISGVTFATNRAHIIRATLESMAYNTKAVLDEMKKSGQKFSLISVDGGGSNNKFLLQFMSDMLNHKIVKSVNSEATVMGAIYMALKTLNLITDEKIKKLTESKEIYAPQMTEKDRKKYYTGWQKAVSRIN